MADPHIGLHLVRTAERVDEVVALQTRLGGRTGLEAMLDDLARTARPGRVPGRAVSWGFRWDREDDRSRRWYPQGITTSSDAHDDGTRAGRRVLVTSAYSRDPDGQVHGARLAVVDVTDRADVRYDNVLLVEPFLREDGAVDLRPLQLHAGGLVWHGDHLHVAGTRGGLAVFRLDDVVRLPGDGEPDRIGVDGDRVNAFGHRFVLPLRFRYDAVADAGVEGLRYSFLSLDRTGEPHMLVAGEYGRERMTTRLLRFEIDPGSRLLTADPPDSGDGAVSRPLELHDHGVGQMQGAVVAHGRWYVTTSAGRCRRGSLWTGRPGALVRHRAVLPVGPEDITYWRSTDELWSLTEYPRRRYVFAMPRARFD